MNIENMTSPEILGYLANLYPSTQAYLTALDEEVGMIKSQLELEKEKRRQERWSGSVLRLVKEENEATTNP